MTQNSEGPFDLWEETCSDIAKYFIDVESEELSQGQGFFTPRQMREKLQREWGQRLAHHPLIQLTRRSIEWLGAHEEFAEGQAFLKAFTEGFEAYIALLNLGKLQEQSHSLFCTLHIKTQVLDSLYAKACQLMQEGDREASLSLFALLAFGDSQKETYWFALAFTFYQLQRHEEAAFAAECAQALRPYQPEYSILLAASYLAMGEYAQSQELWNAADSLLQAYGVKLAPDWEQMKEALATAIAKKMS